MGIKAVGCSKDCVAPLVKCKMGAIGQLWPTITCFKQFIECAIGGCSKPTTAQALMSNAVPKNDVIKTVADACNNLYSICYKLAFTPIQKLTCFNLHLACMGIKAVGCSKDCVAPLVKCKMGAIGQLWPTITCFKDFIQCAIGGCSKPSNPPETALTTLLAKPDFAMFAADQENSISIMKCVTPFMACAKEAGFQSGPLMECTARFGVCMGKEVIECAAHCIPDVGLCALDARSDWIKISLCGVKYLYCVKKACQ